MKKLTVFFISLIMISSIISTNAMAASLNMEVNGKGITFQYGTPFTDSGSSLVPLRDLLIALGVKNDNKHIQWNGKEQSVTAIKDDKTIKLSVGQKELYLNGKLHKTLEVPAQNVDGRVYLPARAVAEAFGFHVGYDAGTRTVLVQEVPFGGGVKADEYTLDSEQFKDSTIDWSSVEKEEAERLERLLYVALSEDGLRIYDRSATNGLEILDVQIQDYEYSLSDKIELPSNLDLIIPLNAFVDSNGNELSAQSGSFFVKITTNLGEFIRFVEFE